MKDLPLGRTHDDDDDDKTIGVKGDWDLWISDLVKKP